MAHIDKLAPYANMAQAMFGAQLAVSHVRGAQVDGLPVTLADAMHGGHCTLGFGLSFLRQSPAVAMTAAAADLTVEDIATRLEATLKLNSKTDPKVLAPASATIPWETVVPLFLALLRKLLGI